MAKTVTEKKTNTTVYVVACALSCLVGVVLGFWLAWLMGIGEIIALNPNVALTPLARLPLFNDLMFGLLFGLIFTALAMLTAHAHERYFTNHA